MTFDELLASYSEDVQALARATRDTILNLMPDALEMVDPPANIIGYGFGRRYRDLVCAIAPQKTYVNLMLSHGATLADPDGLLEGTGKRARHVKIRRLDQPQSPAVRALLQANIDIVRGPRS